MKGGDNQKGLLNWCQMTTLKQISNSLMSFIKEKTIHVLRKCHASQEVKHSS